MTKVSTIAVFESPHSPGRFILVRADEPHPDRFYVWCGRSLGWRPMGDTNEGFYRLYWTEDAAAQAADQAVKLPLPKDLG